jgi:hypothetical protein
MSDDQRSATPKKTRACAKQDAFIEVFAQHGNVTQACKAAGVDRSTAYRWKEHDETFLFRYNQALEDAKDALRAEIRRRAVDGWDEKVYQMGVYAGMVHKYSDLLLIFHSKALMPEYREKTQVDINTHGTVEVYKVRIPDNGRD